MVPLPGWKDILRPIRDGYRHLFPTPDTGPTPEERARQRELDRLKGFAYFDTFEELEEWTEADSDPLQRANTPLLPRSRISRGSDKLKANVILCHDYAGNYHPYEAIQGIGVEHVSYACEYLQFVDSFIYFSHKLVCVPPPSWTNTLHRNGVEALGTVLVEPQTKDIERLLQHQPTGEKGDALDFPIAKKLAVIAKHFGFDGWLINLEKPFPKDQWDPHLLESFLQQLRQELGPNSKLIWYDALTTANKIDYQNALTEKNLSFAQSCGSILTNYSWKESYARDSKQLALSEGLNPHEIFFGVDVWAQNTTKLTHPRITYPEKGGGGTNTGIAVDKLAEIGLSAAIFAPAWTFEHFPGHGRTVEKAIWDGLVLPDDLECGCGGNARQRHPDNRGYPITRLAREWPAGSETLFYTDFTRAFNYHDPEENEKLYGGGKLSNKLHSQLGAQSILPHLRTSVRDDQVESAINVLSAKLKDFGKITTLVLKVQSPPRDGDIKAPNDADVVDETMYERWLPLYRVDMPANGSLQFATSLGLFHPPHLGDKGYMYLKFSSGKFKYFPVSEEKWEGLEGIVECEKQPDNSNDHDDDDDEDDDRLIEIGVFMKARRVVCRPNQFHSILTIVEIRIAPAAPVTSPSDGNGRQCNITSIRLEWRRNLDKEHLRLCWDICFPSSGPSSTTGLPDSDITGPFSYFLIRIKGLDSRAYALEWVVSEALMLGFLGVGDEGEGEEVEILGVGWDGRVVARAVARAKGMVWL